MTDLAFAGAGWAAAIHGLAAAALPGVRVTRVASRSQRSARRRADQTRAEPGRYDELPGGADAVVVATPPAQHLREARRALDAGAAALVEAPLADTLAAADELVAAAAAPGAVVAYAENLVHAPAVAEAVRARRAVGDLTYLDVRIAQGRPERHDHRRSAWGGGALFDPGAHAVALALLLAAPDTVVEASAELEAGAGLAVDDDATLTLSFASGLRARVRVTWRAPLPVWEAQAASAAGALRLELVPETSLEVDAEPVELPAPPPGLASDQLHHLGYVAQLAAFAADVDAGRRPRTSAAFGRAVLDVVCAGYASAASGKPEAVPFTGPRDVTPNALWRPPA